MNTADEPRRQWKCLQEHKHPWDWRGCKVSAWKHIDSNNHIFHFATLLDAMELCSSVPAVALHTRGQRERWHATEQGRREVQKTFPFEQQINKSHVRLNHVIPIFFWVIFSATPFNYLTRNHSSNFAWTKTKLLLLVIYWGNIYKNCVGMQNSIQIYKNALYCLIKFSTTLKPYCFIECFRLFYLFF